MLQQENYKDSSYFKRRSIRQFLDQEVEEWKVKAIEEAFFQTQTAKNQMSWELIVIDDKEHLHQIRAVHTYGLSLETAPLAFVVCSVENVPALRSPLRIEQDLAAASHQLCLMAYEVGLGSTWCGIHPTEDIEIAIKQILHIPDSVMAFSIIAVGYAAIKKDANDKFFPAKVHHNGW